MAASDRPRRGKVHRRGRPAGTDVLVLKQQFNVVTQRRLVVFHDPQVIAAAFDNLDTQRALGEHGITADQHAGQVELTKHQRMPPEQELARQVIAVVGGGSGIGRAGWPAVASRTAGRRLGCRPT